VASKLFFPFGTAIPGKAGDSLKRTGRPNFGGFEKMFTHEDRECFSNWFATISNQIQQLEKDNKSIMATLRDITDGQAAEGVAITALTTTVGQTKTAIEALKAQIAAGGTVTAADLDGVLATITANTAAVSADNTTLEGEVNPPAAPAGAPTA
jgi:hypothetical protein